MDERKRLVESPREMEIVERIIALRDEGIPYHKIATGLNGDGVPSPRGKTWSPASARSVERTHRRLRKEAREGE
jgi:hypothetical protein